MSEIANQDITVCIDAYPGAETDIFRIGVADDILRFLADAHETEFTIPELVDATDVTRSTVWWAVDLLESIGAVRPPTGGNRTRTGGDEFEDRSAEDGSEATALELGPNNCAA